MLPLHNTRLLKEYAELAPDAVESVAARLRIRYHTRGESLGEFDPPGRDGLFIVRKGAVELLDSSGEILEQRGEDRAREGRRRQIS
mgnify:CR=1 FL=1